MYFARPFVRPSVDRVLEPYLFVDTRVDSRSLIPVWIAVR